MKLGKLFWGTLFIVTGLIGLLSNFGIYLNFSVDMDWVIPLLLIFMGLTFIIKDNKLKIIVILIAGLISGLALGSYIWDDHSNKFHFKTKVEIQDDEQSEDELDLSASTTNQVPYYKLNTLKVKLLAAASEMYVSGVDTNAFTANIEGNHFDMDFNQSHNKGFLKIKHQKGETDGLSLRKIGIMLNNEPEYSFYVKSGASDLNLDLSNIKVKKLKADIAATDAEIILGDKQKELNAELKFAASEVTVNIPESAGCLVHGESALVGKTLKGFTQKDENTFVTNNFDQAKSKIKIKIQGALADFEVKRFSK
jgi:Ca2+/Na+ antiporter